jgi:SulP family sulfate permease
LLFTTFGSLIQAVGIGLILASLLFMKKASDLGEEGIQVGSLAGFDGEKPWKDEEKFYEKYKDKVIIKHLYGPLFFGFTSHFKDQLQEISDVDALIIRFDEVPYMDQSGLYALEDALQELQKKEIKVLFTGLKDQPLDLMASIDIIPDVIPEEQLFTNINESFEWLRTHLKNFE